jgi:hypothetical protein
VNAVETPQKHLVRGDYKLLRDLQLRADQQALFKRTDNACTLEKGLETLWNT